MKYVARFVISLNDIYGRVLSGAILLVAIYFLMCRQSDSAHLQGVLSGFYADSKAMFLITFLLVSFLIGHIPHGLSFWWFSYLRRCPSVHSLLSSGFDPTLNERMMELFSQQFNEYALSARDWSVYSYCKDFLQCNYPDLHRSLLQEEAHANLYAGVILPLLFAAVVLAVSGAFVWSTAFLGASLWFLRSFVRSIGGEARSIIRLYYHVMTRDQSIDDESGTGRT